MRIRGFIILVVSIWLIVYALAWIMAPPKSGLGSRSTELCNPVGVEYLPIGPLGLPQRRVVYEIDTSKVAITPWRPASQPAQ